MTSARAVSKSDNAEKTVILVRKRKNLSIQRVVSDTERIPFIEEKNGKNVVKYVTEKLGPDVVSVSELASGEKSGVFLTFSLDNL